MFSKIRSLIFKLDPELAHSLAIKALKLNYIPKSKIEKNESIQTTIFGKTISNPIICIYPMSVKMSCRTVTSVDNKGRISNSGHTILLMCPYDAIWDMG